MNSEVNPWPDACKNIDNVVFILDYQTKTEKAILEKHILKSQQQSKRNRSVSIDADDSSLTKIIDELGQIESPSEDPFFIPLRVSWQIKSGGNSTSLKDLLLGKSTRPGSLRQRFWYKRSPESYELIVGKGAYFSEMKTRFNQNSQGLVLSHYISRLAILALDRSERNLIGARYKVPRMIVDEVIGTSKFQEVVQQLSQKSGQSVEEVEREAKECLKEMAATPTPSGIELTANLGRYMYTRGFEKEIDFAPGDLDRIRTLLSERPVAFLFTHKSHIDGFLLITLFHDLNLPPVHTFGGINMGFLGLGTLLRNAGAIFIRRSFKGDDVYKAVFKHYIDYLGKKRFPVMWALEGTRSRTGKLMPPRFGLINYVINAHIQDDASDLLLMPISIVYDQVPEVGDYDVLQAGGKKTPESPSWFMKYLSGLNIPHGKIHVRFGQGVQVSDFIDPGATGTGIERRSMQKMAFQLAVDVNNATPITVNSLVTYVLLEQGHRAITMEELQKQIELLMKFVTQFKCPVTADVERLDKTGVELALRQLSVTGTVRIDEDGLETVYMIPYDSARTAAYYRNGLIHCFITSAIGEVALLAISETGEQALQQFRSEALRIRDLLKFEFFFEGSEEFIQRLEREFTLRQPQWQELIGRGKEGVSELLKSLDVVLGHGALRPFLEAYWIFSRALLMVADGDVIDPNGLIEKSLAIGRQGVLQHRVHSEESVSRAYFENAVKVAEGRNLFENSEEAKLGRQQLWDELTIMTNNTHALASLVESKRLRKIAYT